MASKQLAVLATLLGIATPGHAFDTRNEAQTVMFYYAIPLDAHSKKDRAPWLGMQINGKRDYQSYNMDSKLFTFNFEESGSAAASALIIGAVAVGAVAVVGSRGKSSQEQVQQKQAATPQPPAPVPCPTDCGK
jgi:hypothetical protein